MLIWIFLAGTIIAFISLIITASSLSDIGRNISCAAFIICGLGLIITFLTLMSSPYERLETSAPLSTTTILPYDKDNRFYSFSGGYYSIKISVDSETSKIETLPAEDVDVFFIKSGDPRIETNNVVYQKGNQWLGTRSYEKKGYKLFIPDTQKTNLEQRS